MKEFVELKIMNSMLSRITLNSPQPEVLVQFYEIFGLVFHHQKVKMGSLIWRAELSSIELEIFGIQETYSKHSANVQLTFEVFDLQDTVEKIRALGCKIMLEPYQTESVWLCYLTDPDGRSVELTQTLESATT